MTKFKKGDNVFHDSGKTVYIVSKVEGDRVHVINRRGMSCGAGDAKKFTKATCKELVDNFNKSCFKDMRIQF